MNGPDVLTRLVQAGMSPAAAEAKWSTAVNVWSVLKGLRDDGPSDAWAGWFVPGRLEVVGTHTDYAGGRSVVAAVERGFVTFAATRADPIVRLVDARHGSAATLSLDVAAGAAAPVWARYAAAVVRRLARNFPAARTGADIAFGSDLPRAAGLSSSSALVVSVALALSWSNRLTADPHFGAAVRTREDLAAWFATVENGADFRTLAGDTGVGTLGGSEDHTAMLAARPGHVSAFRYLPTAREADVPVPPGHRFAVGVSGVVAAKAGRAREAFNRASSTARELVLLWNRALGRTDRTLGAACRSSPAAPSRLRRIARGARGTAFPRRELGERLEQFLLESEVLVPAAVDALRAADPAAFGIACERSQDAMEPLGTLVPETRALARLARQLGAPAARPFGAGFGGSVLALVAAEDAAAFADTWREAYLREFPAMTRRARFFITGAGPAALRL